MLNGLSETNRLEPRACCASWSRGGIHRLKRVGILASSYRKCSFALLLGNNHRPVDPRSWYQPFSMTMSNGRLMELRFCVIAVPTLIQLLIVEVRPQNPPSPVSTALAVDEELLKSCRSRRKLKRNCTCSIRPWVQLLTRPCGWAIISILPIPFTSRKKLIYSHDVRQGPLGC